MYNAIVGKIKVSTHPNADRLACGTVCNESVVVGLETKDDSLVIFFPCDGVLGETFAIANNLVGYTDPTTGARSGGYFSKNRRVRAQKLRGVNSDGFACELSALVKAGVSQKTVDSLKEGDQFCELDKITICGKYVTPATARAQKNKEYQAKKTNKRFPEHQDTKQFRYELGHIPEGSIIYLSEKIHGTSARYAFVQEEVIEKLPWYKRIFKIKPKTILAYKYQAGTRRVILANENQTDFHGSVEYRFDFMKDVWHHLKKGEIIFGEIVGYSGPQTSIMPSVGTDAIKDKTFAKQYGPKMTYKYGCVEGQHKFFVYRIAMANEDGQIFDLPWIQVQRRSEELGLMVIPEISGPHIFSSPEDISELVKQHVDGPSLLDASHIREGVVVRIECARGAYFLKEKSFAFKVLEGIAKDNSDYVDVEEQEG